MIRSALVLLVFLLIGFLVIRGRIVPRADVEQITAPIEALLPPSSTPNPSLSSIPTKKILPTNYHVFQSFNNCGPAALSMALSHYGINKTQQELGQALRPYQVPGGDNDDKSTTLEELAKKSIEFGFIPFHRPGGTPEILKQFIAYDMPVITRTWLKPTDDIGHYRVVKGYDEDIRSFIQDDSLQNKNLWYTYEEFDAIWDKFNYEYLVLVPKEKEQIANAILGRLSDETYAWEQAVERSRDQLSENPQNRDARFNLSVALYHVGDFQGSVDAYEQVASQLPFRTLWYQIEPILSYYELGEYDTVLSMTEQILNNQNRAFSELYIIRGNIYKQRGNTAAAREQYELAVKYNVNLEEAHAALSSL